MRTRHRNGSQSLLARCCQRLFHPLVAVAAILVLGGCASRPLMPYTTDTTPLVLAPAIQGDQQDRRGRFREIFCAVLEARKDSVPDYRPCDEALTTVGKEPPGTGKVVNLGQSQHRLVTLFVAGVGWSCFSDWLEPRNTVTTHVSQFGYNIANLYVDGLSSSTNNARQIRDAIMEMPQEGTQPDLILIGYSKGAPDILEAVVNYPEIRNRVAAVVSIAGSVGGSPLANDATQSQLNMLQYFPGAKCTPGDEGAMDSMRPATRKAWLADNPLPEEIPYYSLITFPEPGRISSLLRGSYRKLGKVDARNDSQLIFYDQFIPGSTLVGYLNADHWAPAVPIARTHDIVGEVLVDQNDYPREALYEALLRFIEEDLQGTGN
ncbi:MAG: hypothetical protein WBN95_01415 [Gammaproteobacteria bacterium]